MLLRAWPRLVCAPLRRGGGNAAEQLVKRLELWRDWGAEFGEREKESSWGEAVRRRQEESAHCVEFVPFSLEAGGVWGPAAKRFFKRCVAQADNQDRDVDLYHWSSAKFESTWRDTLSVLVARGRAQVGVHSAKTDWSRRILDFQYMDYDDQAAHHA